MATRFDERNCNAQCRKCNRFDEGNNIGYTKGLIAKYGEKVIDELFVKKHTISKISNAEYKILIDYYKTEVKKLKDAKTPTPK